MKLRGVNGVFRAEVKSSWGRRPLYIVGSSDLVVMVGFTKGPEVPPFWGGTTALALAGFNGLKSEHLQAVVRWKFWQAGTSSLLPISPLFFSGENRATVLCFR